MPTPADGLSDPVAANRDHSATVDPSTDFMLVRAIPCHEKRKSTPPEEMEVMHLAHAISQYHMTTAGANALRSGDAVRPIRKRDSNRFFYFEPAS